MPYTDQPDTLLSLIRQSLLFMIYVKNHGCNFTDITAHFIASGYVNAINTLLLNIDYYYMPLYLVPAVATFVDDYIDGF